MRTVLKVLLGVLVVAGFVVAGAALPPLRLYDEGTALNQRFRLDFTGNAIACVDDSTVSATECTYSTASPVPMTADDRWYFTFFQAWGSSVTSTTPFWYPRTPDNIAFTKTCSTSALVTVGSSPAEKDGLRCQTTTAAANAASITTNGTVWSTANGPKACFAFALNFTDRPTRAWLYLASAQTMTSSNTPSLSYVGFRYAPSVGANWYACQDNGSGAPNCSDMGVAADTTNHMFCFDCLSGSCVFTIDGAYSTDLGATKLPTAGMGPGIAVLNGATDGGRSGFDHYFSSFALY